MPGMRNLADLKCSRCGREFYGDLQAGQALYTPLLLEKATGVVHDKYGVQWFAKWLRDSYANRVGSPVKFTEETRPGPLSQVVVLNCLDTLYGHCLLKLLNAQYYIDHRPDLDLIVLVPRFLRWMVPDGVAAIWTVDLPLKRGIEWNDWLAAEIKRRIEPLEVCWLSVAFSHPYPEDYDIERFTRVHRFPVEEWSTCLKQPKITFIWREDRVWCDYTWERHYHPSEVSIVKCPRCVLYRLTHRLKRRLFQHPLEEQKQRVVALAQALRQVFPQIDFAVAGLGHPEGLPDWITDLRILEINAQVERALCKRYAQSHVVIGVHGSNMLLPSAHAGTVVELMPPSRWGNILQDLLISDADRREALFHYRIVPMSIHPQECAMLVISLLRYHWFMVLSMRREFCRHGTNELRYLSNRWVSLSL